MEGLGVLLHFSLARYGGVCLLFVFFFMRAGRVVPLYVFCLDNLSNAAVMFGFMLTMTFGRATFFVFAHRSLLLTSFATNERQLCIKFLIVGLEFLYVCF